MKFFYLIFQIFQTWYIIIGFVEAQNLAKTLYFFKRFKLKNILSRNFVSISHKVLAINNQNTKKNIYLSPISCDFKIHRNCKVVRLEISPTQHEF